MTTSRPIFTRHWSQLETTGNPYRIAPLPEMLLPEGVTITRNLKLKGWHEKRHINVLYDKSYVIAWIRACFLKPMRGIPFNVASKLIGEAYRAEKAEQTRIQQQIEEYHGQPGIPEEIEVDLAIKHESLAVDEEF